MQNINENAGAAPEALAPVVHKIPDEIGAALAAQSRAGTQKAAILVILAVALMVCTEVYGKAFTILFCGLWLLILFGVHKAVFAYRQAAAKQKIAWAVELRNQGLYVFDSKNRRTAIRYEQVETIELLDDSFVDDQWHLALVLKAPKGRELARLNDRLENFGDLNRELRRRAALATGRDFNMADLDRPARRQQMRRHVRSAVMGGLAMFLMVSLIAFLGDRLLMEQYKLQNEGLETKGLVLEKYEDGQDVYWVNYKYDTAAGEMFYRVSLPWDMWESLSEGGPVTVKYLAEKPEVNTLAGLPPLPPFWLFLFPLLLCLGPMLIILLLLVLGYNIHTIEGKRYWLKRGEMLEDKLGRDVGRMLGRTEEKPNAFTEEH